VTQSEIDSITVTVDGGAGQHCRRLSSGPLQEGIFFSYLLSGGGEDAYVQPTVLEFAVACRLDDSWLRWSRLLIVMTCSYVGALVGLVSRFRWCGGVRTVA